MSTPHTHPLKNSRIIPVTFAMVILIIIFECNLPPDPASVPPSDLAYDTSFYFAYMNEPFPEIQPQLGNGIADSFTITPPLPEGLLFDPKKGSISGTSKVVTPTNEYKVNAVNKNGFAQTTVFLEIIAPPSFAVQPQGVIISIGNGCSFNALGSGKEPLAYHWTKNGLEIDGSDSTCLFLDTVTAKDTGTYRCVVTDFHGRTVTSDPARLLISSDTIPPHIVIPPSTRSAVPGEKVILAVNAEGPDLIYQWFWNDEAIDGATLNYFQIDSFAVRDTGTYIVIVSNSYGSDTCKPIFLSITNTSSIRHEIFVIINGSGGIRYNNLLISNDSVLQIIDGSTFVLRFLPDSGFIVKKVTIDDTIDSVAQADCFYLFSKTKSNHTIVVRFDTSSAAIEPDSFSCIVFVNDSTAGTIVIQPDRKRFRAGDTVTVTALPEIGYVFTSWEDTPGDSTNPRTIVIRNNLSIMANFSSTSKLETYKVKPGQSLNALLQQIMGSPIPGAIIIPEPGEYDERTVVIEGELEFQILRR